MRSRHDPRVQRWFLRGGRALLGRGYSRIDYDPAQVERMREVFARWPTVMLASHKSYLDGGALNVGFADHGLPPLTVFGGINMAFWPVGSLWRRAGMVFIRRGSVDPLSGSVTSSSQRFEQRRLGLRPGGRPIFATAQMVCCDCCSGCRPSVPT